MFVDYRYDLEGNPQPVIAKKVLLNNAIPEMKSFEEIHHHFQGLIRSKAARWANLYDFDELCQVAAISLWKAYEKYDVELYPVPFVAMAAGYIKYALMNYHNKNKPKFHRKTSQIRSICSLFELINDGSGEGTELQELIGEEETFSQQAADREVLDRLLNRIPPQQREDLFAYVDGYKMRELAAAKDVSSQTVAKRIKHSFLRFRALYIKEFSR